MDGRSTTVIQDSDAGHNLSAWGVQHARTHTKAHDVSILLRGAAILDSKISAPRVRGTAPLSPLSSSVTRGGRLQRDVSP